MEYHSVIRNHDVHLHWLVKILWILISKVASLLDIYFVMEESYIKFKIICIHFGYETNSHKRGMKAFIRYYLRTKSFSPILSLDTENWNHILLSKLTGLGTIPLSFLSWLYSSRVSCTGKGFWLPNFCLKQTNVCLKHPIFSKF